MRDSQKAIHLLGERKERDRGGQSRKWGRGKAGGRAGEARGKGFKGGGSGARASSHFLSLPGEGSGQVRDGDGRRGRKGIAITRMKQGRPGQGRARQGRQGSGRVGRNKSRGRRGVKREPGGSQLSLTALRRIAPESQMGDGEGGRGRAGTGNWGGGDRGGRGENRMGQGGGVKQCGGSGGLGRGGGGV